MFCKICGSSCSAVIYNGLIRDGAVGQLTADPVAIRQCDQCKTIFHNPNPASEDLYQSGAYRKNMGETSRLTNFYSLHDAESMEKFRYTGTDIFRDKVIADIGCGGGAFMDYISNVAKHIICVEPDAEFREEIRRIRGYEVYPWLCDALKIHAGAVDVAVSFDCIEHVDDPLLFLGQAYGLLKKGSGKMIIGTPTDAPVMRELLGKDFERFLFSTQHPWILGKDSFKYMAERIGISNYKIMFYQRYGLGNAIYWLLNKTLGKHINYNFISGGLDALWKNELERQELADYVVFEAYA